MPTNFYFEHYETASEQNLIEDLIDEAIKIHGMNVYYVARTLQNYDKVYGADDSSIYDKAWLVAMYVKTVRGYGGDRDFIRQLGAEVREELTFTVAQREFDTEIGSKTDFQRPREGDLIYFPLAQKCFTIKFAEQREMFYQLGKLYTYELSCELFEYSGEKFATGIPEIDNIAPLSTNIVDWALLTESNEMITDEDGNIIVVDGFDLEKIDPDASNDEIDREAESVLDWTDVDPFSDGNI